jgi:glycosyl transferase family 61
MSTPSHVVHTEPHWLTLRDAIATPFATTALADIMGQPAPSQGIKAFTRGCLYDADGARIALSVRAGGPEGDEVASIDPEQLPPEQRGGTWLTGRALFLGTLMNEYGRFVTESLSRCWLREAGAFDHYVAYPFVDDPGTVQLGDTHRYLAGLLDVPIERVAMLRSQTVFDEIVVPEQLWIHDLQVNARMRVVYERIRARHVGHESAGRIFLSAPPSEHLGNPLAIEEVFAGFGFRIVHPDRMPMAEQLSLYANCAVLAGFSGSFMRNCLFARPGLLTIEVGNRRAPHHPPLGQQMANELAQVEARFIPFGDGAKADIKPKAVRKQLRTILGELERRGPMLLLRLKRRLQRLKRGRNQADLRGGS